VNTCLKETVENTCMPGVRINGQNVNNLRYADDTVFVTVEEEKLQNILIKLQDVRKAYRMQMNVKKMKILVISNKGDKTI